MPSPDREKKYTTQKVDKKAQDFNLWFAVRDGGVTDSMERAGIQGWVVDGRVRHDIIQAIAGSRAIPMRPGDSSSEADVKAKSIFDKWEREWGREMTYLLVADPVDNNQLLLAPVPLDILIPDMPVSEIIDTWLSLVREGDHRQVSYSVAIIARVGRIPWTKPITKG